jgi:arylsulfatase A-like enzyme
MALEFIGRNRPADRPWMLSVNPFDPHPPFDPPWDYYRRYDPSSLPGPHFAESDLAHQEALAAAGIDFQSAPRSIDTEKGQRMQGAYYAMIEQIDHEFGRIIDFLDQRGEFKNTLIIFTSDHGEALGDHGLILKGCRFYEGSTRVPLMISWPGMSRPGAVSPALVELLDLAPTLYDAAGVQTPSWVQGRSLKQVLSGQTEEHREAVRCEFLGAIAFPDQTHATMYRDRRWKLVTYHGKDRAELYDLETDPWEHHDLSELEEHREMLAKLQRRAFDLTVLAHPPDQPRVAPY